MCNHRLGLVSPGPRGGQAKPSQSLQGAPLTGREIELKFRCEPRDLEAVLAAAPGEGLQTRVLTSTYFDTPDGALSRSHMSLRLRNGAGGQTVQTFKQGQGLTRQELEWAAPKGLDLDHRDLRKALKAPVRRALAEAFTVSITRRQRTFVYQGSRIELALDQGEARRGDQRRPICEVELELKSGSANDLFDLARTLSRAAPLRLSFLGKASQGQLLVQPAASFSRDTAPPLTRDTLPGDVFQILARRAFVDLALHAEAYGEFGGVQPLHALRVSTRRLKSYLATFRALLDEGRARAIRHHLNWLLETTAEARNLDVFAQTLLLEDPPVVLAQAVRNAVVAAHARTRGALASGRFRDLLLEIAAWVETEDWRPPSGTSGPLRSARIKPFARRVLNHALNRLRRRAADLRTLDPSGRHEIRLKGKRLRHAFEAFAPLYPSSGSRRYLASLRAIQSDLGDFNDAATSVDLVRDLRLGDDEPMALQLVTARVARLEEGIAATSRRLRRLLAQTPPWAT